jgi:hypothetical protein
MRFWILKAVAILLGIFAGLMLANAQTLGPTQPAPPPPPSYPAGGGQPKAAIKPESPAKPKSAPVVSDKLRGDFFKAQSEAQAAQTALEQARQNAQAMIDVFQAKLKEAQAACGPDHQLSQDQKRELVCVDKPKPVEPAKK